MRLVARQAVNFCVYFRDISRVQHIGHRVALDRMSTPELQREHDHFILREVVFGQPHTSVENRQHMLGFEFLGLRIWTVALEAEGIRRLGAQQMIVLTAVRLVAGGASLLECRLMQKVFLALIGLFGMAGQAYVDRISISEEHTAEIQSLWQL